MHGDVGVYLMAMLYTNRQMVLINNVISMAAVDSNQFEREKNFF